MGLVARVMMMSGEEDGDDSGSGRDSGSDGDNDRVMMSGGERLCVSEREAQRVHGEPANGRVSVAIDQRPCQPKQPESSGSAAEQ